MPPPDPPDRPPPDSWEGVRAAHGVPAVIAAVRLAFITAALLTAYYLLPVDKEFTGGTAVILVLGLLAVLALFLWEVREIEHSPRPILRAAEALVSVLLLFLLLFATVYHLLERAEPGSFNEPLTRTDALYFALTTFATVGYGDITARSQPARIIVMVQMTGGLLLVGVAARLVVDTVKSALRRRAPSEPEA
ncbi:two pore domain potassium channel family protein [Streptomyces verrucosisporus]|uniref:potassium channel family protein n=1 Tax=Streptomyces verrucosisporus TaxID=1695161 RepID=UPI0019D0D75C|nr:potassium channel family protein [Streptomyces verrucosisporus]MBN3929148.1 two pore domain potassium channel family protein [Streptomyces verrucosisporus]